MQMQRQTTIPQSFVLNHRVSKECKTDRRGAANAAPTICSPAFLTSKIEYIRPAERGVSLGFDIDFAKSYKHIRSCCKTFLEGVGEEFDFTPPSLSMPMMLGELIEYFEKKLEPLGLELMVSRKNSYEEFSKVLKCAVFRSGRELDNEIVIIYCAPARYMSPRGCKMFKRFMKFVSASMCIPLGQNSDNFYLDMTLETFESDEDEDGNPTELSQVRKMYKEGGEIWNLFDEIEGLPSQTPDKLYKDLERYRHCCPSNELGLIEVMMDGIDVIKDANKFWFEFNPDDDGFDENDYCEGYSSSVMASAILYSENDGVSDQLLNFVNSEADAGYLFSGWNIHQWLLPKIRKKEIQEFIRCKDLVASLSKWLSRFYQEAEKFDLYGKSEQDTE